MKTWIKRCSIAVLSTVLFACTSTLIWKTTYTSNQPAVAASIAVDVAGNSYIGGALRTSGISIFGLKFDAALIKYDDAGALVWEARIASGSKIQQVISLPSKQLLVATQSEYSLGWSEQDKKTELWLVATSDGQTIRKIGRFETHRLSGLEVTTDAIYVLTSTHKTQQPCGLSCDLSDIEATLFQYSLAGDLIGSKSYAKEVKAFDTNANGELYLAFHDASIAKLDASLNPLWQFNKTSQQQLNHCVKPNAIKTAVQGAWLNCQGKLLRLADNGSVLFVTAFTRYLKHEKNDEKQTKLTQFWNEPERGDADSQMAIDTHGDLYLAATRTTMLGAGQQLGNVLLSHLSVVESDAMIFKVAGSNGEILWVDDVNTPAFVEQKGYVSHFYSPVAVNLTAEQKPLLTFRAVKARYKGGFQNQGGAGTVCASADAMLAVNTCDLEEILASYGKTILYDADTGHRANSMQHKISQPRAVVVNEAGELLVTGDAASEIVDSQGEQHALGWKGLGEARPVSTASAIMLEKHRLFNTDAEKRQSE